MIASKTFNTKVIITDAQFTRDYVLPATKGKGTKLYRAHRGKVFY